jgi:hypothetical protein
MNDKPHSSPNGAKATKSPQARRRTPKQELFLRAYSKCGIVAMAARQTKMSQTNHYRWLATDATYGARFAEAGETAIQHLEELLLKQAEGGNIAAIIFSLKAARPEKYRDNYRIEMTGRDGGPVSMATAVGGGVNHYLHLSDDDLERIAASGLDEAELAPAIPEGPNGQLRIGGPEVE